MSEDKIVFVGRMQNKTRDYIYNLKKENRDLQQENQKLKERIEYLERSNLRKEEVISEQYSEIVGLYSVLDEIREYIKDTCYYPELENYSNMTSDEVLELMDILDKVKE